eukprot:280805_1
MVTQTKMCQFFTATFIFALSIICSFKCERKDECETKQEVTMFDDHYNINNAKIGFIVLEYDEIGEYFIGLVFSQIQNVSFHIARVRNEEITIEAYLKYTKPDLPRAARSILPNTTLSCLTFFCTSGSFVIGQQKTIELLRLGRSKISPAEHYTHMTNSVISSFNIMNLKKIVLITPYIQNVNKVEKQLFTSQGFEIVYMNGLNLTEDTDMSRVSAQYIKHWTLDIINNVLNGSVNFDGIFLSCGGWHAYKVVQDLENIINKPVLTSVVSAVWEVLRLSGVHDKIYGYGSLLTQY